MHQIKLHVNKDVKPKDEPQTKLPYHLQDRVEKVTEEIVSDVIEEYPTTKLLHGFQTWYDINARQIITNNFRY